MLSFLYLMVKILQCRALSPQQKAACFFSVSALRIRCAATTRQNKKRARPRGLALAREIHPPTSGRCALTYAAPR